MNPSQGAIDRDFNRETMQKILLFVQKKKEKEGALRIAITRTINHPLWDRERHKYHVKKGKKKEKNARVPKCLSVAVVKRNSSTQASYP